MLNSEVGSTRTAAGDFGGGSAIPQGQGVNKGALLERKAMFFQRPSSQPARRASLPRKVHGPLEGGSELILQVICIGDGLLAPPPLYVGFGRHLVARGFIGVLVVLVMDQLPERSSD